jgi:hypothetical protein
LPEWLPEEKRRRLGHQQFGDSLSRNVARGDNPTAFLESQKVVVAADAPVRMAVAEYLWKTQQAWRRLLFERNQIRPFANSV